MRNIEPLAYATSRKRVKRSVRWLAVGGILLAAYVASFAFAFQHRKPAGNLAYFVYVNNDYDTVLYYAFWPIYKLYRLTQSRYPSGNRHNLDRDPIPMITGP